MDVSMARDLHLLLWRWGWGYLHVNCIIACCRWTHYVVGIPTVWDLMMVSMMVSRQRRILFWLFIGKAGKKLSKEKSILPPLLMELLREGSFSKCCGRVCPVFMELWLAGDWAPGLLLLLCECDSWLYSFIPSLISSFLYRHLSFCLII